MCTIFTFIQEAYHISVCDFNLDCNSYRLREHAKMHTSCRQITIYWLPERKAQHRPKQIHYTEYLQFRHIYKIQNKLLTSCNARNTLKKSFIFTDTQPFSLRKYTGFKLICVHLFTFLTYCDFKSYLETSSNG